MSYHILHLLSPGLRIRLRSEQLLVTDSESGKERSVALSDVSAIVAAAADMQITAGALRRMAELNVLLLVCNERFEPCSVTLPYYRATNTEVLRRQLEWSAAWKQAMWRKIIVAKVRNQAANVSDLKRVFSVLNEIAARCENPKPDAATEGRPSLASVTPSKRRAHLLDSPEASESRAARHYWRQLVPRLARTQETGEERRIPGTRQGVNGMLDYGYAIIRTAVLRSLAVHGFIAAIGIAHSAKAGSFALADDLMEPLRPWMDQQLRGFLVRGPRTMKEWVPEAVDVLRIEAAMGGVRVRLLNAIDLYVQSFAKATLARAALPLRIPMLS